MIYRLKSLSLMPPKGWNFFQPETNWRIQNPVQIDYQTAVRQIINHRKANPAKNLSTDPETVGAQLQNYIAHQIKFDPNYVIAAGDDKKKVAHPGFFQRVAKSVEHAVDAVRKTVGGAKVLSEWLGEGGIPVSQQEAQMRANVCLKCPMNRPRRGRIAFAVASAILEHERTRTELALTVNGEKSLKVCSVCSCHLPLKVFVPMKHLRATDDLEKFPPNCWLVNPPKPRKKISIQRAAAFGDAISASALATKLKDQGVEIEWRSKDVVVPIFFNHPDIDAAVPVHDRTKPDVNLDATYELHKDRGHRHIADLYVEAANPQLIAAGLLPVNRMNWFPKVHVDELEKNWCHNFMSKFPKPWIVICPRSNSWLNRHVPFETWAKLKEHLPGTLFWTGTERCGAPIVDLNCRSFERIIAAASCASVFVTVDSGPMHAAAAVKAPMVVIQQPFRIDLRLTDQMDYITTGADLPCLGCDQYVCPMVPKGQDIPCCNPPAKRIADAIKRKLYAPGSISAIIPAYKADLARLQRCIDAVSDQVDEIVIAIDGLMPNLNAGLTPNPKIRYSQNPNGQRNGHGKTCNRASREASGEFLLMLNDDCFMDPGSVKKMAAVMADNVAVVGCLLRYPNGVIQHGGTAPTGPLQWGHLDHGKRVPSVTTVAEMDYVTFASALVRRKAFFQVQGFDELYDCYNADSDLCVTMRKAGWKILYNPDATGIHQESQTTSPMKAEMTARDQAVMNEKWKGGL